MLNIFFSIALLLFIIIIYYHYYLSYFIIIIIIIIIIKFIIIIIYYFYYLLFLFFHSKKTPKKTKQKINFFIQKVAPEVILKNGTNTSADIWSVGCVVIELVTGKPPYFDLGPMAAMFRITSDDHPPIPENLSDDLVHFLHCCFQMNPFDRYTAKQLLDHPWIPPSSYFRDVCFLFIFVFYLFLFLIYFCFYFNLFYFLFILFIFYLFI